MSGGISIYRPHATFYITSPPLPRLRIPSAEKEELKIERWLEVLDMRSNGKAFMFLRLGTLRLLMGELELPLSPPHVSLSCFVQGVFPFIL